MLIRYFLFIATLLIAGHVHSITAEQSKGIATGESDSRVEALNKALASADDKTAAFLQALLDDEARVQAVNLGLHDAQEAAQAFRDKRLPVFDGR